MSNPSASYTKKIRRYELFFLLVDICFSIVLCVLVKDLYLFSGIYFSQIPLLYFFGFDSEILLAGSNVTRYLLFSFLYKFGYIQLFTTLSILYVQTVLSRKYSKLFNSRITIPMFVGVILIHYGNPFLESSVDLKIQRNINVLTRLYVVTHLSVQLIIFKFSAVSEERNLGKTSILLKEKIEDELKFMKRFSHFSRTSLNGIMNLAYFMRSSVLETIDYNEIEKLDELDEIFKTLRNCSKIILRQIEDLTEYFLIQSDRFSLGIIPVKCNLRNIVEFVCSIEKELKLDMDERKSLLTSFSHNVDPRLPKKIIIDKNRLIQVLTNVVGNSIKYTNKGNVELDIVLDDEGEIPMILIICRDTGIGIRPENIERIFEPFVKIQETSKQSFSIGLFITKSIVNSMGGEIRLFSEGRNTGTRAEIRLPLKLPEGEDMISSMPNIVPQLEEGEDNVDSEEEVELDMFSSLRMRKVVTPIERKCYDVLIVEDNIINMSVFKKQVEVLTEGSDIEIFEAVDGEEALELFKHFEALKDDRDDPVERKRRTCGCAHLPVVLTDLDMPNVDGYELCKRLRKKYGNKIVIIANTATIVTSVDVFQKQHMFDGISFKPTPIMEMKKILTDAFRTRWDREAREMDNQGRNTVKVGEDSGDHDQKSKEKQTLKFGVAVEVGEQVKDTWEIIKKNLMMSGFVFFLDHLIWLTCEPQYSHRWGYLYVDYIVILIQMAFLFKPTRTSVQAMSIFTTLALFIKDVIAAENGVFQLIQSMFLCYIGFIFFTTETIWNTKLSVGLSAFWYIKVFYYEITRSEDYFYLMNESSYLKFCNLCTFFFFAVNIVQICTSIVSANKARKNKLNELISRMKKLEHSHNLAMSRISHDLVTPAAALYSYIISITQKMSKQLVHANNSSFVFFTMIEKCSLCLRIAVQNFMTCCKYKNGKIVSEILEVEGIHEKLCKIVNEYRDMLMLGNIKLTIHESGMTPWLKHRYKKVYIDWNNFQSVFTNLLTNAILHSQGNVIQIQYQLGRKDRDNDDVYLRVEISDNGLGMSQGIWRKLKLDEPMVEPKDFHFRERFSNRMGLGVTVCKILMKEMGGCMRIQKNRSGRGIWARFLLPVITEQEYNVVEEEEIVVEVRVKKRMKKYTGTISSVSLPYYKNEKANDKKIVKNKNDVKILVIDDQLMCLSFMKFYLEKEGFKNVLATTSAEEGIEIMANEKFDLLFVDYKLGEMDGLELLDRIKMEDKPWKVVLFTAGSTKKSMCGELVDEIMYKPANMEKTTKVLKKLGFLDMEEVFDHFPL